MISVEDDDLAGLEDVSSDHEDDNYEAELSDTEVLLTGTVPVKRPYRKRIRSMFLYCLPLHSYGYVDNLY